MNVWERRLKFIEMIRLVLMKLDEDEARSMMENLSLATKKYAHVEPVHVLTVEEADALGFPFNVFSSLSEAEVEEIHELLEQSPT